MGTVKGCPAIMNTKRVERFGYVGGEIKNNKDSEGVLIV